MTCRRYVISHLHAWHSFGRTVCAEDASTLHFALSKMFATCGMFLGFGAPAWAESFRVDLKATLKQTSFVLLEKICRKE